MGIATSFQLSQHSRHRVVVLEKESGLGLHQSGRNSGVLHSGVYYAPGSRRAQLCLQGRRSLVAFCEQEGVPHEICGKVIVASGAHDVPRLRLLHSRGKANGVDCELIGPEALQEREPYVCGTAALLVRDAGIVDFSSALHRLAARAREHGATIILNARVSAMRTARHHVELATPDRTFQARQVLNCAGLYADRIARLGGQRPSVRIVPFRGEYYVLRADARKYCKHLIYPAGNPALPFLGIHLTRMTSGHVLCGPSAVVAFAREGYHLRTVNPKDLADILTYPGFLRMAMRHWRTGLAEIGRTASMQGYLKSVRRLVPAIEPADLQPASSGVRAQCVAPSGDLVRGMHLVKTDRMVSALGTASPSATSALSIGRLLARTMEARL